MRLWIGNDGMNELVVFVANLYVFKFCNENDDVLLGRVLVSRSTCICRVEESFQLRGVIFVPVFSIQSDEWFVEMGLPSSASNEVENFIILHVNLWR